VNDKEFAEFLNNSVPMNLNIQKYMMVTRNKLREYERITVSYSAGSDSDIMADLIELVKPPGECGEIRYIFFNTGLEYDATLRHITEAEQVYGITVELIKPIKTIPAACREHGVPFICKDISNVMNRLQRHGFDWHDLPENATPEKYGRCKSALDWYFCRRALGKNGKSSYQINRYKLLREFIMANPPDFKISDKCCDYAKKNVSNEFDKAFKPDLKIIGMRQAEGGRRAGSVKNCFTPAKESSIANYRPLWFFTDEDKRIYKEWRGIRYSDCYEVWGFKRTGCAGCPCSSKALEELKIAAQYEPGKVKAAFTVFGESYEYREAYNNFKKTNGVIRANKLEIASD
jgi:3'-phosphoadenosine 5'-phosphosulfate sulfotransferase (PAPS reductase)/FAD synthetase